MAKYVKRTRDTELPSVQILAPLLYYHLASLGFSFITFKMKIILSISWDCWEIKQMVYTKGLPISKKQEVYNFIFFSNTQTAFLVCVFPLVTLCCLRLGLFWILRCPLSLWLPSSKGGNNSHLATLLPCIPQIHWDCTYVGKKEWWYGIKKLFPLDR